MAVISSNHLIPLCHQPLLSQKMALFVTSVCQVVGDTVISQAAWSNADNVAALTAFTVDDQDKEINQVVFANNEVSDTVFANKQRKVLTIHCVEQGELFASYDISHDYEATVMQWHPYDRVLAIGWADGEYCRVGTVVFLR